MKSQTGIIVVLVVGLLAVGAIALRAAHTADYWRKQYDAAKHPIVLTCSGRVAAVVTDPRDADAKYWCSANEHAEWWAFWPASVTKIAGNK